MSSVGTNTVAFCILDVIHNKRVFHSYPKSTSLFLFDALSAEKMFNYLLEISHTFCCVTSCSVICQVWGKQVLYLQWNQKLSLPNCAQEAFRIRRLVSSVSKSNDTSYAIARAISFTIECDLAHVKHSRNKSYDSLTRTRHCRLLQSAKLMLVSLKMSTWVWLKSVLRSGSYYADTVASLAMANSAKHVKEARLRSLIVLDERACMSLSGRLLAALRSAVGAISIHFSIFIPHLVVGMVWFQSCTQVSYEYEGRSQCGRLLYSLLPSRFWKKLVFDDTFQDYG